MRSGGYAFISALLLEVILGGHVKAETNANDIKVPAQRADFKCAEAKKAGDFDAAFGFMIEAAELGSYSGAIELAGTFNTGEMLPVFVKPEHSAKFKKWRIPIDKVKAEYWHRKAVEYGGPKSGSNLACFLYQQGDTRSRNEAYAWMKKAADAGAVSAKIKLSAYLRRGVGVPPNETEANRVLIEGLALLYAKLPNPNHDILTDNDDVFPEPLRELLRRSEGRSLSSGTCAPVDHDGENIAAVAAAGSKK